MKIVLWGTYDTSKPRIRILREGLRALGIDVNEIHTNVWEDLTDKSSLRGTGKWLQRALLLLAAYPGLVWRYLRVPAHDLVLVSYPGLIDVLVMRPFAWMRRKPVALDWFISAFDTVVEDRKLLSRRNPLAALLWTCEWLSCGAADFIFMDTAAHARRMEELFRLAPHSVGRVWVGAEETFFRPNARQDRGDCLQVLFYGQFIPLHGIETIVQAARLLRGAPVRWTLIGRGQESTRIRSLLAEQPMPQLRWLEWVPYDTLVEHIGQADVCLGIFGTSGKAASVIPNKVFQVVASGCPLVTRNSAAIRELLADDPPCVRLVHAGDAQALADAVEEHIRIAHTVTFPCHTASREKITPPEIARQFLAEIGKRFPDLGKPNDH